MNILLANKFYYPRGGDCVCTINLQNLLEKQGHKVAIFSMAYPANISSPWEKYFPGEVKFTPGLGMIEAFRRPFGTKEVKKKFNALLDDFKPDIVHLNNIHTQLSPVIAKLAKDRGIKVVWTLHDYKLLCPRYDCLRNGKQICEECFTDKEKVLEYNCMKNSKLASLLAYREAKVWTREKLEECTDMFICPSNFMQTKMNQGGFNPQKLVSLCNFIDVERTQRDWSEKGDYYCFIGRLSHEKGVKTLIQAAKQLPYKLIIIGGGPLEEELNSSAKGTNVELVGYKQWSEIKDIVGKARFTVIPSEWYENNPVSVIESQCLGTPVLGANIGGIPELIDEGKSGMLFESRNVNNLKDRIEQMFSAVYNYEELAKTAHQRYNAEKHYRELMKIYNI